MQGPKWVSWPLAAWLAIFTAHGLPAQDRAVLLHWNDFHGQVLPVQGSGASQEGGVRALARRLSELRAAEGAERVLLLDAGDWFQGTPEGNLPRGRMVVDLFNAMGLSAAAVGNHDFDFGVENLRELIQVASFPVLSANLVDADGQRQPYVEGFRVLSAGGIRFGILGLLTPDTPRIVRQDVGRTLRVADPAEVCRQALPMMRAAGAECFVVLSHLGILADRALAAAVPELHLIVGGHSHTALLQPERTAQGTVLAQAGSRGRYLGRLQVARRAEGGFEIAGTLEALVATSGPAPAAVEQVLMRYQAEVDGAMEEVVGQLPQAIEPSARGSMGSSPLGNWLARVMAGAAGVSIALHNKGGIRSSLPTGPVAVRQLYEVSPFGNEIVVCELTGADLLEVLSTSIRDARVRLEVSGLTLLLEDREGETHLRSVQVGGQPLDPAAAYSVATSDYLASGGDGWQQFQRRSPARSTGIGIFEASLAALRATGTVQVDTSEHFVHALDEPTLRAELPLGQRAMSLLGMLAILGLGYTFSTARHAIRLRTVLWGVGLQLLFASILLPRSATVSFCSMFVLVALVGAYLTDRMSLGQGSKRWAARALMIVGCGVGVYAGILLEAQGVTRWLLWAAFAVWGVGLGLHRARLVQGAMLGMLVLGLARVWAHEVTGQQCMRFVSDKVVAFLGMAQVGSTMLFGNLARPEHFFPGSDSWPGFGFQFAFTVLPTIIFFSTFMAVLYQLGVVQFVVGALARFMRWSMQTSGSETVSCSANIFVGQTEAPFLIKPFLPGMTVSELHAVMVGGFATIAGGVLAAYVAMGVDAGYLIAASVMAAPAGLVLSKLLCPETGHSETAGDAPDPEIPLADNIVMAAANGVTDGLKLAVNVGAMLIGFMALIAFMDSVLGWLDVAIDGNWLGCALDPVSKEYVGWIPGSLKTFLGSLFKPLAYLMGVPWEDAGKVGYLLGIKIGANEFVAYGALQGYMQGGSLDPRSIVIATFALCGFANFASVGIQIGGIGAICPGRRADLARLGLRAMFGGALASCMTATVAGMLL